jgi:hypothetical protein
MCLSRFTVRNPRSRLRLLGMPFGLLRIAVFILVRRVKMLACRLKMMFCRFQVRLPYHLQTSPQPENHLTRTSGLPIPHSGHSPNKENLSRKSKPHTMAAPAVLEVYDKRPLCDSGETPAELFPKTRRNPKSILIFFAHHIRLINL